MPDRKNQIKFTNIIFLISICGASLPTQALTVGDYKDMLKHKSEYVDFYVLGIGEGFSWANVVNQDKNLATLYCQPKELALNVENYKRVIEDELEKYPEIYKDNIEVEIALLRGLMRTFPCDRQ